MVTLITVPEVASDVIEGLSRECETKAKWAAIIIYWLQQEQLHYMEKEISLISVTCPFLNYDWRFQVSYLKGIWFNTILFTCTNTFNEFSVTCTDVMNSSSSCLLQNLFYLLGTLVRSAPCLLRELAFLLALFRVLRTLHTGPLQLGSLDWCRMARKQHPMLLLWAVGWETVVKMTYCSVSL